MQELFAWYNLIFTIPLLMGVLFMMGIAFGLGEAKSDFKDFDADGIDDFEAEAELDADGDSDGETSGILSVLGFGKVPAVLVLGTMLLTYGGTGFILNRIFAFAINPVPILVAGPFLASIVVMFLATGFAARTFARWLPSTETTSVKLHDLEGATGELILDSDAKDGLAKFTHNGDLYQLRVMTTDGPLPKGTRVLVTEYDEATHKCLVCKDPTNDLI